MSVDYKLIGSRIKAKRKAIGKTQEQLAEKLSVSVGYISQLERGVTKISLDTLSEICTALEGDMGFFVTGATTGDPAYLQEEWVGRYERLTVQQRQIVLDMMDVLIKNR